MRAEPLVDNTTSARRRWPAAALALLQPGCSGGDGGGGEASRPLRGGHAYECGWQPPAQAEPGEGALPGGGVPYSSQQMPPIMGEQRVLVKLLPNTANTTLTDAQVGQAVLGEVDAYCRTVSFVRAWLGGDLVHVSPQSNDPQVNEDAYPCHVVIHPTESGGSAGGVEVNNYCAPEPCHPNAWIEICAGNDDRWLQTTVHELGHAFDLGHANHLYCGIDPFFSPSSGCEIQTYLGVFGGSMGFWMGHLNARQALNVGWLDDEQVITVAASGVFAIEPMSATSAGPKALRIQRASTETGAARIGVQHGKGLAVLWLIVASAVCAVCAACASGTSADGSAGEDAGGTDGSNSAGGALGGSAEVGGEGAGGEGAGGVNGGGGAAGAGGAVSGGCGGEVTAAATHTCARRTDGTAYCWGLNGGQIGNGTTTASPKPSPVKITALGAATAVAARLWHTCARKADGTLWCWGDNHYGQLGIGTVGTAEPSPIQVASLGSSVAQVAAGAGHTCAVEVDRTLWCWGDHHYGEIGDGTTFGPACLSLHCQPSPQKVQLPCP